jgi:hypothetical protein
LHLGFEDCPKWLQCEYVEEFVKEISELPFFQRDAKVNLSMGFLEVLRQMKNDLWTFSPLGVFMVRWREIVDL